MPIGKGSRRPLLVAIVMFLLIYAFMTVLVSTPTIAPSDDRNFESVSLIEKNRYDVGEVEGSSHVPLFTLAGLLGLMALISGLKNSKFKSVRELVPIDIPRRFHRIVSVAYYAVFLGTFTLWSFQYYAAKGMIFYTAHGIVGLTSVLFAVLSIITGMAMFYWPKKWRNVHWAFNIGTLALLFITMFMGLGLDD